MKPLLSIVVPTKNRYQYLKKLIELFLNIASNDMELVIQDNSHNPYEFRLFLAGVNDKRIRYFYCEEDLSVVDNCNYAIKNSCGEFVTMIGDDDGFHQDIIKCAKYMKKKGIDSMIGQRAFYNWPDAKGVLFDYSAKLRLPHYSQKIHEFNTKDLVLKMFKTSNFMILDNLPCVYNGIISRERLNQVYNITNSFFPGPSPDMANSVALSVLNLKHVKYDFPFSIAGKCSSSAGGKGAMHKHVSTIEECRHLPKDTLKKWKSEIPKYWTGPTIYAQSAIEAAERMNDLSLINKFNYSALLGVLYVSVPEVYKLFKVSSMPFNICSFGLGSSIMFYQRVCALINNVCIRLHLSKTKVVSNITDIIHCEKTLNNFVRSNL